MFAVHSAVNSIIRVSEESMAKTNGCKSEKKCTLDELIYMQWTSGNVTNNLPKEYVLSKYRWDKTTCITKSWPSKQ
tara:strand:+ start:514 stop:741 length:228 start_codon:yes stop_codon:yes gene_type:complete